MSVYVTPVSSTLLPVTVKAFSAITGVPNSIETTILTYAPIGYETIGDIIIGGSDYGRFNIYINTVLRFVLRTGPQRYGGLSLQRPMEFTLGDIIDVKVIHYNMSYTADFETTITGI